MVYQGPSKGCNSCRWRRKKCDETRPSCMRCIRANRPCGGYEHGSSSTFRQYAAQGTWSPTAGPSTARKCGIPKRVPIPGTDILPEDTIPTEVSQLESNGLALRAFFYDYCIVSTNENLSRGFLSGLEPLIHSLGPKSDLAKACQAIAFASHGKPLNRPQLVRKSELFYQDLLGSFARVMESPSTTNIGRSMRVSMLLGLYQIVMSNENEHGDHEAHARGLAALMATNRLPNNPYGTASSYLRDFLLSSGAFSIQALADENGSLVNLLTTLDMLWRELQASRELKDLIVLRKECIALDQRFTEWEDSRPPEFRPITVGHMRQNQRAIRSAAGYWPGRVDTYFDLYVAGVWNIFRAARLLLAALIVETSDATGEIGSWEEMQQSAICTIQDMIASIPYHLTENLQVFLSEQAKSTEISEPGKHLGGLLLTHPLYVAFKMPFLSAEIRGYLQECLLWIGSNMGIGHAIRLAKVS